MFCNVCSNKKTKQKKQYKKRYIIFKNMCGGHKSLSNIAEHAVDLTYARLNNILFFSKLFLVSSMDNIITDQ